MPVASLPHTTLLSQQLSQWDQSNCPSALPPTPSTLTSAPPSMPTPTATPSSKATWHRQNPSSSTAMKILSRATRKFVFFFFLPAARLKSAWLTTAVFLWCVPEFPQLWATEQVDIMETYWSLTLSISTTVNARTRNFHGLVVPVFLWKLSGPRVCITPVSHWLPSWEHTVTLRNTVLLSYILMCIIKIIY